MATANDPADPILAIIHGAGLSGFKGSKDAPPERIADAEADLAIIHAAGVAGFKGSKEAPATRIEEAEADLAIIRAAGVEGFHGSAEASARPAGHGDTGALEQSPVDPVLAMVRTAGVPGFNASTDDEATTARLRPQALHAGEQPSRTTAATPAQASTVPPVATSTGQLSARPYAVLSIPAGKEAELAIIEERLGHSFAADFNGQPYWSGSPDGAGGMKRAFDINRHQLGQISKATGALAGTSLTLSVDKIPLSQFSRTGPGAVGPCASGHPPQLPLEVTDRINRL